LISAKEKTGIDVLIQEIMRELESYAMEVELLIPHDKAGVLSRLHDQGRIHAVAHEDAGVRVKVTIPRSAARSIHRYLLHKDQVED